MKMDIMVVIPTINIDMCLVLVERIISLKNGPRYVLIINNSEKEYHHKNFSFFDFGVFNSDVNIGVNASWNLAMAIHSNMQLYNWQCHLSILNDDIEIEDDFFERISYGLNVIGDAGVICPLTNDQNDFDNRYIRMSKREGWAFTIKNSIVAKIPKIPKEIFTFFGDDWIFYHTNKLGYHWYKDTTCRIKHKVGISTLKAPGVKQKLEDERKVFHEIMSKIK